MRKALLIVAAIFLPGSAIVRQNEMQPSFRVYLNHFFSVVDSETYKAIESDSFLRGQFAPSEQRTTVRTDITYTGVYFYGANTYFEFFDASKSGRRLGDVGLAFGTDNAGDMEALVKESSSEFFIQPRPITRLYNDKQVPWFFMAVPKNLPASLGLNLWVMEYHPRFLSEWNPQATRDKEGVKRAQILRRYGAVLGTRPARPLLGDVTALTIALDKTALTKMAELGQTFGYRRSIQGSATLLEGPGVLLRLTPETASSRGVREIVFKVRAKPAAKSEFRIGKSVLKFRDDGIAIWTFESRS